MMTKLLKYFLLSVPVYMLMSCDPSRVYDKFKDIENAKWNKNEHVKFDVQIDDTVSYNNVFINIRNSGDYRYSNIYLFISTVYPDRKISTDTVECILANEEGKWLGKGLGDIKDNQILFKKNVRFHQTGIYTFGFEQAMRTDDLKGIKSVGIRIEKIK
ncbi:MAG: gliding motility lipoprotein GldH [Bacteroidota bacterium]